MRTLDHGYDEQHHEHHLIGRHHADLLGGPHRSPPRSARPGKTHEIVDHSLSVRAYNVLKREGIHYVHQMLALDIGDVGDVRKPGMQTAQMVADLQPRVRAQLHRRPSPYIRLRSVTCSRA